MCKIDKQISKYITNKSSALIVGIWACSKFSFRLWTDKRQTTLISNQRTNILQRRSHFFAGLELLYYTRFMLSFDIKWDLYHMKNMNGFMVKCLILGIWLKKRWTICVGFFCLKKMQKCFFSKIEIVCIYFKSKFCRLPWLFSWPVKRTEKVKNDVNLIEFFRG